MLRKYMASLRMTISTAIKPKALPAMDPSSSGWKLPRRPARTVERRM
jgi:hypothetical protein